MARLSAKKEAWYDIPGDEDGAKIKIKHLSPGDLQKISNETSRWVGKSENDKMVSELEYQPIKQMELTRKAAVVDWDNFYDETGVKLKCSNKNVELYLNHDPEIGADSEGRSKTFSEWIDYFRVELEKTVAPREAVEGN